jgi:A/G-specific adenine glycosylase
MDSKANISTFRSAVYRYYRAHGRHGLPWRHTQDSYHIYVSEIMLQQTQVDRVIAKYTAFIEQFGSWHQLAHAPLSAVLQRWQGLGYNRRAKMLHQAAEKVVSLYQGVLPQDPAILQTLPGLGAATAASIAAFAFNRPVVFIETNIRTVFLHHFFPSQLGIRDEQLLPIVADALDRTRPGRWYSALMDYGVHLKKTLPNPSRRSAHHSKQSRFEGSDRQIRGAVIRMLLNKPGQTLGALNKAVGDPGDRVKGIVAGLCTEGLISLRGRRYFPG